MFLLQTDDCELHTESCLQPKLVVKLQDISSDLEFPNNKSPCLLTLPLSCSKIRASFLEGFPSGQRDQTVNLTAQPSEVQILPPPPDFMPLLSDFTIE